MKTLGLKIFRLSILLIFMMGFKACVDPVDLTTSDAKVGGLLNPSSMLISYVIGSGNTYTVGFTVYQKGPVKTTAIKVYKSFYNTIKGKWSNEVLATTIDVSNTTDNNDVSTGFNYSQLIDGLSLDGKPLSTNDDSLNIGDYWQIRPVSVTDQNTEHDQAFVVKLSVSTRFAGTYDVTDQEYWRIGVNRSDVAWPAQMSIESLTSSLYHQIGYFGPFSGEELYFTIINDVIDYPAKAPNGDDQNSGGNPLITCITDPADMSNVHCDNTNFVTRDDVKGKDKLTMSYGYYTSGSGSRECYQVLVKQP